MKLKSIRLKVIIESVSVLALISMVIFIIIMWGNLPERIPMHRNFAGEVDNWGNKVMIIIVPFFSCFIYFLLSLMNLLLSSLCDTEKNDKKKVAIYKDLNNMVRLLKMEIIILFTYNFISDITAQSFSPLFVSVSLVIIMGTIIMYCLKAVVILIKKQT